MRALKSIRIARAAARERAWELAGDAAPGWGGEPAPVDLDATIVIAHSDEEQATPTWKKSFGFHPLTAFADHGAAGGGEALAVLLREGKAGSNTAADHIETVKLALAGTARRWEPKRLRLRLFSCAERIVKGGRRLRLRLARTWPWADLITTAITRLQALPAP